MLDLTVLALDRGGRRDNLHAHAATVGSVSRAQQALDDGEDALVVPAERAEILVDHVELVYDLERRRSIVERLGERLDRGCRRRVALRPSLVTLAAAAEPVQGAPAVDVTEQGERNGRSARCWRACPASRRSGREGIDRSPCRRCRPVFPGRRPDIRELSRRSDGSGGRTSTDRERQYGHSSTTRTSRRRSSSAISRSRTDWSRLSEFGVLPSPAKKPTANGSPPEPPTLSRSATLAERTSSAAAMKLT